MVFINRRVFVSGQLVDISIIESSNLCYYAPENSAHFLVLNISAFSAQLIAENRV